MILESTRLILNIVFWVYSLALHKGINIISAFRRFGSECYKVCHSVWIYAIFKKSKLLRKSNWMQYIHFLLYFSNHTKWIIFHFSLRWAMHLGDLLTHVFCIINHALFKISTLIFHKSKFNIWINLSFLFL